MMLLKGCHRCWGGLRINNDIYGEHKQCVQCGYMEDLDPRSNTASSETGAKAYKKAA